MDFEYFDEKMDRSWAATGFLVFRGSSDFSKVKNEIPSVTRKITKKAYVYPPIIATYN